MKFTAVFAGMLSGLSVIFGPPAKSETSYKGLTYDMFTGGNTEEIPKKGEIPCDGPIDKVIKIRISKLIDNLYISQSAVRDIKEKYPKDKSPPSQDDEEEGDGQELDLTAPDPDPSDWNTRFDILLPKFDYNPDYKRHPHRILLKIILKDKKLEFVHPVKTEPNGQYKAGGAIKESTESSGMFCGLHQYIESNENDPFDKNKKLKVIKISIQDTGEGTSGSINIGVIVKEKNQGKNYALPIYLDPKVKNNGQEPPAAK